MLLLAAFLMNACDEEEDGLLDFDDGQGYDFKDQVIQGTINGKDWEFKQGTAGIEESEISIQLSPEEASDPCDVFTRTPDQIVFFTVNAEVGVYELKFDFDDFEDNQTITMLDRDAGDGGPLNIIATSGAVEILSVTNTEVTGRIDARESSSSSINGNFTVQICQN